MEIIKNPVYSIRDIIIDLPSLNVLDNGFKAVKQIFLRKSNSKGLLYQPEIGVTRPVFVDLIRIDLSRPNVRHITLSSQCVRI